MTHTETKQSPRVPTTARVFARAPTLNKNRRRRLGLLLRDAICAGDDDRGGHAAEEAVLKDTARGLEVRRGLGRVLDRRVEEDVDDVQAVVSDGRVRAVDRVVSRGAQAQLGLASGERGQLRDRAHGVLPAEGCDLDGQREGGSEAVDDL